MVLELGRGRCLTLIGVGSDAVGHALRNVEGERSAPNPLPSVANGKTGALNAGRLGVGGNDRATHRGAPWHYWHNCHSVRGLWTAGSRWSISAT
jgi:hypothetical protein